MNYPKSLIFTLLSCLFLCTNCKTAKKAIAQNAPIITNPCAASTLPTNDIFFNYFNAQNIDIQWLAADVDLDIDMGGKSISLGMTLRMCRDSAIWMNVTKWGINVARVLVRPDSVFVLNYFQSQAIMLPMTAIKERAGFDINFTTLQNILLGNPTFVGNAENLTLTPSDTGIDIKNKLNSLEIDFQLNKKCQILNAEIKRANDPAKINVFYSKYEPFNNNFSDRFFSFSRKLVLQGTGSNDGTIIFAFDSPLEINVPKKMRFEIPNDYKKIDKF